MRSESVQKFPSSEVCPSRTIGFWSPIKKFDTQEPFWSPMSLTGALKELPRRSVSECAAGPPNNEKKAPGAIHNSRVPW